VSTLPSRSSRVVVDRPGSGGRHTSVIVGPGPDEAWPAQMSVGVGYGSFVLVPLSEADTLGLIDALKACLPDGGPR
jgi:hypothetical protein